MEPRRFSVSEVHHFALAIASAMRSSMRHTAARAHSLICLLSMNSTVRFICPGQVLNRLQQP